MCGIIGFISQSKRYQNAGQEIIKQYQNQWGRGTSGFGMVEIFNKDYDIHRATEPTSALMELRLTNAPILMFHHRTPTSTDNTLRQTHPISVSNKELDHDFLVMHNGVIRNDTELFKAHKEIGYEYTTLQLSNYGNAQYSYITEKFNDTEALAIELARYFDGKSTEIDIKGGAAFLCLMINKKTRQPIKMIWGRNDINPLEILETENGLLIASSIPSAKSKSIIADMYHEFNLADFQKKTSKNLQDFITDHELKHKKEEEKKPIIIPRLTTSKSTVKAIVLEDARKIQLPNSKIFTQENLITTLEKNTYTAREAAFYKMSSRITNRIGVKLDELFQTMAHAEVSQGEFDKIIESLDMEIREKAEDARKYIRPMFNRLEIAQTNKELEDENFSSKKKEDLHYDDEDDDTNSSIAEDRKAGFVI